MQPTISSTNRSFELLKANKRVLELMAYNRPLNDILNSIVELIETFAGGCISTAYFVENGKLCLGAAPSFPESFVKVVDGCPIGHNQGTCGHAAFHGTRAISTDVTKDEVWGPFRDWILSYGIQAAWSTPVIGENGTVLATVSMCWKEPRIPTEWDFEVVDAAASLMRIAVDRKKQEAMIVEQRLMLMANSRLAALGEMSANLAHEINNPMSIIMGHAFKLNRLSQGNLLTPEQVQKTTGDIEKTVGRVTGIIKGLRAISKNGDSDPFDVADIVKIIEETLSFCRERFRGAAVELRFETPLQPVLVECRSVQISQALLNLINNAFDAVFELQEKWVAISIKVARDFCILEVIDSGVGIQEGLRSQIMQPFFTTKSSFNGTGLGLSISKKIVEDHGGQLYVKETTLNTTFVIELPLLQKS